ncbi:hypothetical protein T261_02409 [Streptomyces lydicus]|nr:hypothetical protein T261_02409 [Streptomyces lydicus]
MDTADRKSGGGRRIPSPATASCTVHRAIGPEFSDQLQPLVDPQPSHR